MINVGLLLKFSVVEMNPILEMVDLFWLWDRLWIMGFFCCRLLILFGFRMGFKSCDCEWWICFGFGMNLESLFVGFDGSGDGGLWV